MTENITNKRFVDSIFKFKWTGFSIENYWANNPENHNAVFLNYNGGYDVGGEYVKIYCDGLIRQAPHLRIDIYLLDRKKGTVCTQDLLLKTFYDFADYRKYIENDLLVDIKQLNDSKKEFYD